MDRERLRRAALSAGGNPRRRLIAYGILALLILGLYVYQQGKQPATSGRLPPVADDAPTTMPGIRETLAAVDPVRLAPVRDATPSERAYLEPDALEHLVTEASLLVFGDMSRMGSEPADRDALLADPGAHRGRPMWVLGTLQFSESVPGPFGSLTRGSLEDEHGRPWSFLAVTAPDELRVGDVVRLEGFFFKLHDLPGAPDGEVTRPLLVTEQLLRSAWPLPPVTELREDLFRRLRDDDLAQASQPIEGPEFYELLSYVLHTPEERLFPPDEPLVEHATGRLMQQSDAFRGQPVRVSGTLSHVEQVPLGPRGENPLRVPLIWKLWLTNASGPSLVYSFQPPGDMVVRQDIVDADGIYFRRYAYENQLGNPYTAAVVIAKRYARFEREPDVILPLVTKVVIGIVAVLAVALFVAGRSDRAGEREARSRRVQRQKKLTQLPGLLHRPRGAKDAPPTSTPDAPEASPGDRPAGPP